MLEIFTLSLTIIGSVGALINYRYGVAALILFMPLSYTDVFAHRMLGIAALNPLNILFVLTLISWAARKLGSASRYRLIDNKLLWLYLVPVAFATGQGAFHLQEIPSYVRDAPNSAVYNNPLAYIAIIFVKPLLIIILALVTGAAVSDSKKPRSLLLPGLLSLWFLSIAQIFGIYSSGASLSDLARPEARALANVVGKESGMNPNEIAILLSTGYAIVLFTLPTIKTAGFRLLMFGTLCAIAVSIILTFSRTGFVAVVLVTATYFFARRSIGKIALGALVFAAAAVFTPQAVIDRATTGMHEKNVSAISAGRVDMIWIPLLPTVLHNPVLGNGIRSIWWSPLGKTGIFPGRPHNSYLGLLLDMGIVGFVLVLAFFWNSWKQLRAMLAAETDPLLRGLFEGTSIALAVLIVCGMAADVFAPPDITQFYFWIGLGFLYGRRFALAAPPVRKSLAAPQIVRA